MKAGGGGLQKYLFFTIKPLKNKYYQPYDQGAEPPELPRQQQMLLAPAIYTNGRLHRCRLHGEALLVI